MTVYTSRARGNAIADIQAMLQCAVDSNLAVGYDLEQIATGLVDRYDRERTEEPRTQSAPFARAAPSERAAEVREQLADDGRKEFSVGSVSYPAKGYRGDDLENPLADLWARVEALERWRSTFKAEMVVAPPALVTCAQCHGQGRVPGAAVGGYVTCSGCRGAGVHRV